MLFDQKDNPMSVAPMSLEQMCNALEAMINKSDGDKKAKLQQAYDLVEEIKDGGDSKEQEDDKMEGSDDSEPEDNEDQQKPMMNTDLLLGPMGKLKGYLAQKSVDHQSQM